MKKTLLLVIAATTVIGTSGCAHSPQTVQLISKFQASQARQQLEKGNGTIKGSGLLRQRGGGVVTCAGNEVMLIPFTTYAAERVSAIYGNPNGGYASIYNAGRIKFDPDLPEYRVLMKKTLCDAQGYFKFTNVSPGNFYVFTKIVWAVKGAEGGTIAEKISVADGEEKEIVLTAH